MLLRSESAKSCQCHASTTIVFGLLFLFAISTFASGSVQEKADPKATLDYSVALGFQRKKLFPQAATRWQRFVATHPNDKRVAAALHHLGVCEIQQGKFVEAAARFKQVLAKYPKFGSRDSCQFNVALALYNVGLTSNKPEDFRAAAGEFASVVANYAKSGLVDRALFYQAECLCLAQGHQEAIEIYRRIISGHPNSSLISQTQFALGVTFEQLDQQDNAVAALQEFTKKYPKSPLVPEAHLRLGLLKRAQKQLEEAERFLGQAASVKGFENADFAWMKQAQTMFERGKLPGAANRYQQLPKQFPASKFVGAALVSAGKCLYQDKKYPPALQQFAQVISEKLPEADEAAHWHGQTLIRLNKPADAIGQLEGAIKTYSKSSFVPLYHYTRLEAMINIKDRQPEAIKSFAEFADKFPDHLKAASALYRAVYESAQRSDYDNALSYAEKFLGDDRFANNEFCPEVLLVAADAQLRSAKPNPEKAELLYRKILKDFPKHSHIPRAHLGIADCRYAEKQYDAAIAHLEGHKAVFSEPELVAELQLLIGRNHLAANRADEALAALRLAVAAKPDWGRIDEGLFLLGLALRKAGQLDAALAEFAKVITTYKDSGYRDQGIYQKGSILLEQNKLDEASASFQQVGSEHPKSKFVAAALYGVASVQFRKDDLGKTIATLNKLIAEHPKEAAAKDGRQLRAISNLRSGKHEPALADFKAFLADDPPAGKVAAARFGAVRCQLGLKQIDSAIAAMSALIKEHEDFEQIDEVYYELGFAHLEKKQTQLAIVAFQTLSTKFPNSPLAAECWYRVGEAHEAGNRLDEALAAFQSGLSTPADKTVREKLLYKAGSLLFKKQGYEDAVKVLQNQVAEFSEGELIFAANYLIGESLYRSNRHADAMPLFKTVVDSTDPKAKEFQGRSHYRMGGCAAAVKDWELSRKHYEILSAQFPKFEQIGEARYGLGMALQYLDRLDEAKEIFKAITESDPISVTAAKSWFMMGQCCFAQKQYEQAIDHFSQVAFGFKHDQWQPLSYFEAGRCFLQLKDNKSAGKMFQALVNEFPNHERSKDAKSILDRIGKQ